MLPFAKAIQHGGRKIQFDAGSVRVADTVPLTVDHEPGVSSVIGVMRRGAESQDGFYADLEFANTQLAQETRELIRMGAVDGISAGVLLEKETRDKAGVTHLSGSFDHITIAVKPAFGKESRVVAVHSAEGDTMETEETVETSAEPSADIVRLQAETDTLRKMVTELSMPGSKKEIVRPFTDIKDFILTFAAANKGDSRARAKVEEFALADDTTTSAAGLVPDYFSKDIIGLIFNERPYVSSIPSDPIGSYGMTIQYPRRTQKPVVDVQASEKTEVASQQTTFDFITMDLVTYAGASDVSMQLIERSDPSFVSRLFQEYAGVYAEKTDSDAVQAAVAGAGNSTVLADLGADAAATWAAVASASTTIYTEVRRSPNNMLLSPDRWGQLISLTDSDGRPLVVLSPQGPQNAQGVGGGFNGVTANYNGLNVIVDANAPVGTCLIYWSGAAVTVEQTPQELRAVQVSLLGMDMGVWGMFSHFIKYPEGIFEIAAA